MMLFKNKSNTKSKLFYLSVIPALSVLIASTLVFNTSKARDMVQTIEDRIQDVSLPLREQPSEEPVQTPSFQGEHAREHTSLEIPRPMESRAETSVNRTDTIRDTTRQARLVLRGTLDTTDADGNKLFQSVAVQPEFPGGMTAFRKWVAKNYRYPQSAIDAGVKGVVEATYVVEKDGSLTDIKILKDLSHGTGEALIDLLKKSPKWNPGAQNGRVVRVQYKLPVGLSTENMDGRNVGLVNTDGENDTRIFQSVAIQPEFKGGMEEFRKWIAANFDYPQAAIDAGVKGAIETTFVVEKDGSLSDIKVLKDLGHDTDQAAIDLLKKSPKWSPGVQNGRAVRVQYKLPIALNLQ